MVTMATRVGIRELRDNLTALMRRVRDGETIEVTHHGKPVAVISPAEDDWYAHLVATGRVIPAKKSMSELPPPLPAVEGKTLFEILMEERDSYD